MFLDNQRAAASSQMFLQRGSLKSVRLCHTESGRLHQDISKTPLNLLHFVVMWLVSSNDGKSSLIEISNVSFGNCMKKKQMSMWMTLKLT